MNNTLHYLATPIKHSEANVVESRYYLNLEAFNTLRKAGIFVYSPMIHHYVAKTMYDWGNEWSFWRDSSLWMVERADILVILMIDGWELSEGVRHEVVHACNKAKPIMAMHDVHKPELKLLSVEEIKTIINRHYGKFATLA